MTIKCYDFELEGSSEDPTKAVLFNIGSLYDYNFEFYGNFSTDSYSFPDGIQNETWVVEKDGEYLIDLNTGYAKWLEVLQWRMKNLVINSGSLTGVYNFDTIVYDKADRYKQYSPRIGDQSLLALSLIKELHEWVEANGSGEYDFGVSVPFNYPDQTGTAADWIRTDASCIFINGLQVDQDGDYLEYIDTNKNITQAMLLREQCFINDNLDVPVYALDYMPTYKDSGSGEILDSVIVARGQELCLRNSWNYNCVPTGTGEPYFIYPIDKQYNYGYVSDIDKMFGKKDLPWSKVSGITKLQQRSEFHELNRVLNGDLTYPTNPALPKEALFGIPASNYNSLDGKSYRYSKYWYTIDGIVIGENTGLSNGSGELEIQVDWKTPDVDTQEADIYIYKDPGVRSELVARQLSVQSDNMAYIRTVVREANDSGLNAVLDLQVNGSPPATDYHTIYLEAPWVNYSTDDKLFIDFSIGRVYNITIKVTDLENNLLENVEVFAESSVGSIAEQSVITDSDGLASFTVDLTTESVTGVGVGTLTVFIPRANLSTEAILNLVGCDYD